MKKIMIFIVLVFIGFAVRGIVASSIESTNNQSIDVSQELYTQCMDALPTSTPNAKSICQCAGDTVEDDYSSEELARFYKTDRSGYAKYMKSVGYNCALQYK